MPQGISEVVCEASLADGGEATAYRALRQLECASCGKLIAEGTLFIRRKLHGQSLPIMPQCQECAPFTLRPPKARSSSPLIEALLSSKQEQRPTAQTDERAAREVERRLGRVLEATRRRRRESSE